MIDFEAMADALYPTTAPNAPAVPPIEAKTTTEPSAAVVPTDTTTELNTTEVPYTLALPQDAALEASAIERTVAFAKANHLSPEVAQQTLNHANAEVVADRDRQTEAWTKLTRETWVTETKNDPEVGGEKFTGALTNARRFLEQFGDKDIRNYLDDTGWGNNRHLIRMLSRAMTRMESEKHGGGAGGSAARKSDAEVLYGNTSGR